MVECFVDNSGWMMILEAKNAHEAEQIAQNDPYDAIFSCTLRPNP